MKTRDNQRTTLILLASSAVIFVLVVVGVFLTHVLTGISEFTFNLSISRYVGMRIWSNVLYTAASFYIAYCALRFLFLGHVPKAYRYAGIFVVGVLLMVALFPIDLYQNEFIDLIHNITARVLLFSMVLHTLLGAFCFRKDKKIFVTCLCSLAVDSIVILIAFGFPNVFWLYTFLFEALVVSSYYVVLLTICAQNVSVSQDVKVHGEVDNQDKA